MLAFGFVMFAIGALLANVASVRLFALLALLLAAGAFAQGVWVGWSIGEAALVAIVSFVCGQVGYVAGIGARAYIAARFGRVPATETPLASQEPKFDKGAGLNGGH